LRLGLIIYGPLDQNSGGYLYDRKLVAHLRRNGHRVEVLSLPWRSYAGHLLDNFSSALVSKIEKLKLDVLIQDELNHPSLFLINQKIKTELAVPIVSLVHHLRSSEQHPVLWLAIYRAVEKRYLKSVDGFIFNSQTTQRVVNAMLDRPKPNVVALPGGDRLAPKISAAEIRRRARQPGPLRVLYLGNLIRRKAPHLLLQAAAALPPGTLLLTLAGGTQAEPGYVAELQALVQRSGLEPWVEFSGYLDDRGVTRLLRAYQVLAVPSSYEGFGIAYVEGMGFGLPAIGTRAGAAPELIRNGKTGYLIDVGNASQLARLLGRLHADRATLAKISAAARKHWEQQPTWPHSLARIEQFLSSYNHASPGHPEKRRKP
jgi:glycosyltransferase involved in cell wall biosynthesis